jgi:hypothetical protein
MNLGELRILLTQFLDEDGIRRPDAQLDVSLNAGYRVVALVTQACERTKSFIYDGDSHFQFLTGDFFVPINVYFDGVRLFPQRIADFDLVSSTWINDDSSTPVYYTTLGALRQYPELWLYPRPTSSGTVKMTYAQVPDPMTLDSDTPLFPQEHHSVIAWWAYGWELLKERGYLLAGKTFQIMLRFIEEANRLQQYTYRRTPDRDWITTPWDIEAVKRKLLDFEQATQKRPSVEPQQLIA